jgi:Potential Queuosine, Q, salvage protein family
MNIAEEINTDLSISNSTKIDNNKLDMLQKELSKLTREIPPNSWLDSRYWPGSECSQEVISQYFTLGNSINFMYWSPDKNAIKYAHGKKGGIEARGAMYMWRSLKQCVDNNTYPLLDARQLSKIKLEDMRLIFRDDDGRDVLPELEERLLNWQDLGYKLSEYWKGKTINILKKCNDSLYYFIQFFRQFRAFDDPLSKMIMVNALMHTQRGISNFKESIMPGMDYQILKQLLRQGVLIPNTQVANKISKYEILTKDEALDLRKGGLRSLLRIMDQTGIAGHIIDNLIWNNRNKCEDKTPVCMIPGREKECPFLNFCEKKTEMFIPLEKTRLY